MSSRDITIRVGAQTQARCEWLLAAWQAEAERKNEDCLWHTWQEVCETLCILGMGDRLDAATRSITTTKGGAA